MRIRILTILAGDGVSSFKDISKTWQRARLRLGSWAGELWVKCGPPLTTSFVINHGPGCSIKTKNPSVISLRYETNLRCPHTDNKTCWIRAEQVELLPRFAGHVEYLTCDEFRRSMWRCDAPMEDVTSGN